MAQLTLAPHQWFSKEFIKTRPNAGLFLDCGGGKTLSTLVAICELNEPYHVLVLAPKTVAQSTWINEIEKWGLPIRHKSLIVNEKGKPLQKKDRLALYEEILGSLPTMWFLNYDLFADLVNHMPVYNGKNVWPFGTMIFDELHMMKAHNTNRHKLLKIVRPCTFRTIGLTGTPSPNGLMDLWGEIYALDQGARLGPTITYYRNTFFRPVLFVNNRPVRFELLPGAKEEIYRRISDIAVAPDIQGLQLPKVNYNNIPVDMDEDEKAIYRRLVRDKVLTLAVNDGDEVVIQPANAAVLQQKLIQLANGALYYEPDSHDYVKVHERKLDICEHIVGTTGSPVLIAYHFKSDLDMLKKRFPDGVVFTGSLEQQNDWNSGKIDLAFIQPASCARGINIQSGPGHTLVWYSLDWNYEQYYQLNRRLVRPGQTHPVTIHHILTRGTIDERTLVALNTKAANEQELIDAVRWSLYNMP